MGRRRFGLLLVNFCFFDLIITAFTGVQGYLIRWDSLKDEARAWGGMHVAPALYFPAVIEAGMLPFH